MLNANDEKEIVREFFWELYDKHGIHPVQIKDLLYEVMEEIVDNADEVSEEDEERDG